VEVTIPYNTKLTLKGAADVIHHGWGEIIEIKTIKELPDKPLEHHLDQLKLYLAMYECVECKKWRGRLVYISREGVKEYVFDYRNLIGDIGGESFILSYIDGFLTNKISPRYEWECYYCPLRGICQVAHLEKFNDKSLHLYEEEEEDE